MIGYVTLGTNDIDKAAAFYDEVLAEMSAVRVTEQDRVVIWGTGMDKPMFSAIEPYDGEPATAGNGVMIALKVESRAIVESVYNKAIALGAQSEGELGVRGSEKAGLYGGYFRDMDGNKLFVYCMAG